jgi:hypothetical protein
LRQVSHTDIFQQLVSTRALDLGAVRGKPKGIHIWRFTQKIQRSQVMLGFWQMFFHCSFLIVGNLVLSAANGQCENLQRISDFWS